MDLYKYHNTMKFLGVFQNHNLPKIDMPKLFAYVDSREVIVSYNKEQPFYVEQVSILIDREYQTYAVFECGFMCSSDEDAKSFGKNFTQALIDFLRYYQEIDDNISTFGLDIHRD